MEKNSSFKPAVIYARVSSKKQVKEGSGLDSQNSRCRFYAQARGYDVVATFTDDMTGSKVHRPGMDAMLNYLKQNKTTPHICIVDDISRLARGVNTHWKLREAIAKAGGILESPSVKFGDDSDSHFIENVLASSSQHFRQKNREQTISRMKQRLRNGYYVQARPAAGYKYIKGNGKEIVRDEPIASIVQEALEGFNTGRFGSAGEMRQFLQDQPEFPKPKSGIVTHERAFVLLRNYTYAGMLDARNWKMGIIKGNHEPIISYEMFLKNQGLLVSKKRVSNRVNISNDFILRGAVACGDCGNALTAAWSKSKTGKRHPYYLCHKKGCASYRKSIRRDQIEGDFETLLQALQPTKQLFDIAGKMFKDLWEFQTLSNAERIKRLRGQITKIDTDMSKLVDKLIDTENALVVSKIEDKINQMEQNKLAIVQKCGILGKPKRGYSEMFELALRFLSSPWNIWEKGSFIDRRNVLKLAFTGQVPYTRENGFSNPKISLPFKVLGGFESTEKVMAHWGGFEPPTP